MDKPVVSGDNLEDRIGNLHKEDVVLEFRGDHPEQLITDCYYRGEVDGYAEFGVFVDIGDHVTGLLHRSELDSRLESLDWEPGDTVYVQVKNVRDNGNVDLGWSIRAAESEFRGSFVHDPSGEAVEDEPEEEGADEPAETEIDPTPRVEEGDGPATNGGTNVVIEEPTQVEIGSLAEHVGEDVRLEGEVVGIRQTSGPTVFELRDETDVVDCAAFEQAGVRAYPEVEEGDVVRLDGEVRKRREELQVETETLSVLEAEERDAVQERIEAALDAEARPDAVDPLVEDPVVEGVSEGIREAATAVRRAVLEGRPVVVRHSATVDGYVAGVALEQATLPLVREEQEGSDAEYHYFDRRPLESGVYGLDDATKDLTRMLDNRERHDEALPLFVFAAAGASRESLDGFDLLSVYGAPRVLVDAAPVDPAVADAVDVAVSPGDDGTTASVLAANVAAHVDEGVRETIAHLPAVSFWEDAPEAYVEAADAAGYDAEATREIREAIALEAFFQAYEDKRELVGDLLFGETSAAEDGLATHVSRQFRTKVDTEVETAEANLERRTVGETEFAVLDTKAYTHHYEFPPTDLLLDVLFRGHREGVDVLVGIDADELYLRSDTSLDVHDVVAAAREAVPNAGVDAKSARGGRLEFISGERDAVLEAVLEAVAAAY